MSIIYKDKKVYHHLYADKHNVCPRYADRHLYGKFEFYIYFTVYHAVQSDLLLQNQLISLSMVTANE